MNRFKEFLTDKGFMKGSFFIVFNAFLLCVVFFIIKNFGSLSSTLLGWISVLLDALQPLFIGLILAYLLNPLSSVIDRKLMGSFLKLPDDPVKSEKRKNTRHLLSVLITYVVVIAALAAVIYGFAVMIFGDVIISNLSTFVADFAASLPKYQTALTSWIEHNLPEGMFAEKLSEVTAFISEWLNSHIDVSSIFTFFTNASDNIIDLVVGVIISIYLMKDKQLFLGMWQKFVDLALPQKSKGVITETLGEINLVLSQFIRGAMLDALIIAILSSIGLSVMGLEASVFIGVFAGLANVIPYFGPVLGMIPAFLMGLCTEGFWSGALAVLILLAIQQIDCNLIYPKIVGSSTGLHPLMVLLSVSVFGYFGGILGMLLAVPIAGIIQIFVHRWVDSREAALKEREGSGTE